MPFLDGNEAAAIIPHCGDAGYALIERTLIRSRCHVALSRAARLPLLGRSDDPANRGSVAAPGGSATIVGGGGLP